jgi:two-component system LytT family response regulator
MPSTIQIKRDLEIELNEVQYLQADINYTLFFLHGKQKIISSSSLKRFDLLLKDSHFRRINKSVMVNTNFVSDYKNNTIFLHDGTAFKVSRRRRNFTF